MVETSLSRVGNVSGEADAAFMAELKRTDRPRYDRLIHAMQKQAFKDQKARPQPTDSKGQFLAVSSPEPISQSPDQNQGLGAKEPASEPLEAA